MWSFCSVWQQGPVLWQLGGVMLGFQKGLRVAQLSVSVAETEDTGKASSEPPCWPLSLWLFCPVHFCSEYSLWFSLSLWEARGWHPLGVFEHLDDRTHITPILVLVSMAISPQWKELKYLSAKDFGNSSILVPPSKHPLSHLLPIWFAQGHLGLKPLSLQPSWAKDSPSSLILPGTTSQLMCFTNSPPPHYAYGRKSNPPMTPFHTRQGEPFWILLLILILAAGMSFRTISLAISCVNMKEGNDLTTFTLVNGACVSVP